MQPTFPTWIVYGEDGFPKTAKQNGSCMGALWCSYRSGGSFDSPSTNPFNYIGVPPGATMLDFYLCVSDKEHLELADNFYARVIYPIIPASILKHLKIMPYSVDDFNKLLDNLPKTDGKVVPGLFKHNIVPHYGLPWVRIQMDLTKLPAAQCFVVADLFRTVTGQPSNAQRTLRLMDVWDLRGDLALWLSLNTAWQVSSHMLLQAATLPDDWKELISKWSYSAALLDADLDRVSNERDKVASEQCQWVLRDGYNMDISSRISPWEFSRELNAATHLKYRSGVHPYTGKATADHAKKDYSLVVEKITNAPMHKPHHDLFVTELVPYFQQLSKGSNAARS